MMGYSTQFNGKLEFTSEITGPQLLGLSKILGKDRRDHPAWPKVGGNDYWFFVDLQVTEDFTGLEWDGAEKAYGMVEVVNTILAIMRKDFPGFGLEGRLDAQGEDIGDVWALEVSEGGTARKVPYELQGRRVECPRCHEEFVLDGTLVEVEDAS